MHRGFLSCLAAGGFRLQNAMRRAERCVAVVAACSVAAVALYLSVLCSSLHANSDEIISVELQSGLLPSCMGAFVSPGRSPADSTAGLVLRDLRFVCFACVKT